jgi:GT2 family glycosyltransferase
MPDFISEMVYFLEKHPEAGMITPKIKFYKNKNYIWNAGASINYRKTIVVINRGYLDYDPDNQKYNEVEKIGFAPGTALFIKKKVIDEIGLMDEIFFMYHEDPDWNFRAQEKGYISYYVPSTIVYHNVPIKQEEKRVLFNFFFFKRNSNILVWKYADFKDLFYFLIISFFAILYEITLHLINRKFIFLFFPLYALYRGMIIGVKRRTNRSCRKNIVKDYHIVRRLQKF